jgi:hypothetical protein
MDVEVPYPSQAVFDNGQCSHLSLGIRSIISALHKIFSKNSAIYGFQQQ